MDQGHVIVLGETAGKVTDTGKDFGYSWVQLFEIGQEGLVRRIVEFMDSHALVRAFTVGN